MSNWISLCNDAAVSLFGSVLAASFCGALRTRRNRVIFWTAMALIPIVQSWIYAVWDAEFLRRIYPLLVHLPLLLVLYVLTKRWLWPLISILTAYLSCQLRRWIALLIAAALGGGEVMQDVFELLLTLPILLLLLRFAVPGVRKLSDYPARAQCQFGIIPAVYYGFDYLTRVYTNLLSSGEPVAVEFMPFVCCAAYLVFLLYNSAEEQERSRLQQVQSNLNLQLSQAVHEIDALRRSQTLAKQYRHDLRHHLQYVSACIENGQEDAAQAYISNICQEIEAQKVQRYCENEAANLILSAFVGRAEKLGITMQIQGALPAFILVSDNDLCVLLSNALENALHACAPIAADGTPCTIQVQLYQRADRLFLQVSNPYRTPVQFENGIPVSNQPGHGIGIQSICSIVARYGGVYSFLTQDGQFFLRLSL